jgi:hypothetical protein
MFTNQIQFIANQLAELQSGSAANAAVDRLTQMIVAAAAAHHKHEAELGHPDPVWASWYAQWIIDNGGSVL